jgi:hypothetical protein
VSDDGLRASRPAARQGLSVELVGIPGAGKSHLARTLTGALGGRGDAVLQPQLRLGPSVPPARRLVRKAVASVATALLSPVTTGRVVRGVALSRQPTSADLAERVVQWLVAQDALSTAARHDGVSIVDEGPIQALWSIGLRGDVEPVLAALDSSPGWRSPDLLVVVGVPPEVALSRLADRPSQHSRTQLLAEHERLGELQRGARLLDRLADWWSSSRPQGSGEVLVVSGTEQNTAGRDRLLERLSGR